MNRTAPLAVLALSAGLAHAQVAPATLKIAVGQTLPGTESLTCSSLNDPYTNGLGKVGFTGNSSGGNFIWYDNGVVWLNSDAVGHTLTGTEGTMGVSNAGGFAYSPSIDGGDGLWTQAGYLLNEADPLPPLPGKFSSFNSRPRMTDSGAVIWPAGIRDTAGGATTNRCFLRVNDPSSPIFELLILGGGTYGELTTTTSASNFAYDISGNGEHRIHILQATGPTTADMFCYLADTDTVVAREGSPTPAGGENYGASLRIPSINNGGHWAVPASTTAAAANNEIIVYDGAVAAREGDALTGGTLAGTVDAMSINNVGRMAAIWSGSPEALFTGPAATFGAAGRLVAKVGDAMDFDGDGLCDFTIASFSASQTIAPGLDLADDGMVWCRITMAPCGGGAAISAIVGFVDVEVCAADFNGDGFLDFFDSDAFVSCFEGGECPPGRTADFNGDGFVDFFDSDAFVEAFEAGCG